MSKKKEMQDLQKTWSTIAQDKWYDDKDVLQGKI